jgi:hypothetical protein
MIPRSIDLQDINLQRTRVQRKLQLERKTLYEYPGCRTDHVIGVICIYLRTLEHEYHHFIVITVMPAINDITRVLP